MNEELEKNIEDLAKETAALADTVKFLTQMIETHTKILNYILDLMKNDVTKRTNENTEENANE